MQSSTDTDILIVGAGISGINAAYRVQTETPLNYEILEARNDLGGTWSLFQYPGIRSDSDLHSFGFPFRPWEGNQSIADGDAIYNYVKDTAEEFGIDKKIRYNTEVRSAEWSSAERRWTLTLHSRESGKETTKTCKFVLFCSGYYDYQGGYQPQITGMDDYQGKWIHPQAWPKDYDYTGKKMVVIGSGATGVTLLPNLAKKAKHVTLLQRSPSYFVALSNKGGRDIWSYLLPTVVYHSLLRFFLALRSYIFYWACQGFPSIARYILRSLTKRQLPSRLSIDPHFSPNYNPWDQRVCVVPDGDMFKALRDGNADIATGAIEHITRNGIKLTDGSELKADVIVCATGLNMKLFGGASLIVDGEKVDTSKRFMFRGQMLTNVPNASLCFGYVNASWTLGSDCCAIFVCRLINEMLRKNISHVTPQPPSDLSIEDSQPMTALSSGYFKRGLKVLPRGAGRGVWQLKHNYFLDFATARGWGLAWNPFEKMDVSYGEVKKVK